VPNRFNMLKDITERCTYFGPCSNHEIWTI